MTKKTSPWQDMGEQLQGEISDLAPKLANDLFGEQWPGTSNITDTKAASIIQDAYTRGDRPFLQHLAQQGPQQFLRVWKNLGGTIPPGPGEPIDMSGTPGGAGGPEMQQAAQGQATNA